MCCRESLLLGAQYLGVVLEGAQGVGYLLEGPNTVVR